MYELKFNLFDLKSMIMIIIKWELVIMISFDIMKLMLVNLVTNLDQSLTFGN